MSNTTITDKDRELAKQCLDCKLCQKAREKQKGFVYMFVKWLDASICPACKAYEKVYGKKAYDPVT